MQSQVLADIWLEIKNCPLDNSFCYKGTYQQKLKFLISSFCHHTFEGFPVHTVFLDDNSGNINTCNSFSDVA